MVVHCFFEQSGVFKNEFKKLGINAYDYDILNDFGQTDYVLDLFIEIENAYQFKPSIFDTISSDDLIFAFFPCVRFEQQIMLSFRGESSFQKLWSYEDKLLYDIQLSNELNNFYVILCKFVIICLRRGLRLIIENPYNAQHFLTKYWCIKPLIIDSNRFLRGDFYCKPTQYFFINFLPKNNFCSESVVYQNCQKYVVSESKVNRSLISSDYARRFILEFVI